MVPGLYRESSVAVVQTLLLHSMWDIPRPKVQPVSPALAGGFFITDPPGKSNIQTYCLS